MVVDASYVGSRTRQYPVSKGINEISAENYLKGAAMLVQRITAWYAISELGACKRGDGVLVQSAAGGVGLNALAILRRIGARVVAAVGSESKAAFLVEHDRLERRQIIVRDRRTFASQLGDAKVLMLVDRRSGGMVGVTLFDSEEAMRKGDEAMNAGPGNAGSASSSTISDGGRSSERMRSVRSGRPAR